MSFIYLDITRNCVPKLSLISLEKVVEMEVELTANHKGYFQFRLCPHNRKDKPVSQKCLDRHVLSQQSGTELQ